jgi:glutamine amidotransferase
MRKLNSSGLRDALDHTVLKEHKPLLAVCIGMHMLGRHSEEGSLVGLGYIGGVTKKLPNSSMSKAVILPHMGWNEIEVVTNNKYFNGIKNLDHMYFTHSYEFELEEIRTISAYTIYNKKIVAAVEKDNIFGTQFHPEKSQINGLKMLGNFLKK